MGWCFEMVCTKHDVMKKRQSVKQGKGGSVSQGGKVQDVNKVRLTWGGPVTGGVMPVKKKPRYRTGTVVLREIRQYQKSTDLLLKKSPFCRLVRERGLLLRSDGGLRYQKSVMGVFQEITEVYLVTVLEDAQVLTVYRGKKGLQPRDIRIVFRIRHQTSHGWTVPPPAKRQKRS